MDKNKYNICLAWIYVCMWMKPIITFRPRGARGPRWPRGPTFPTSPAFSTSPPAPLSLRSEDGQTHQCGHTCLQENTHDCWTSGEDAVIVRLSQSFWQYIYSSWWKVKSLTQERRIYAHSRHFLPLTSLNPLDPVLFIFFEHKVCNCLYVWSENLNKNK